MNVAGIDPGLIGAVAVVNSIGCGIVDLCNMPTTNKEVDAVVLIDTLQDWGVKHVYLEKAQSMPKQGVVSMFTYGVGYGMIRGALAAAKIPYTLIHPATWKKVMCKDMERGKAASIVRVKQLYPELRLKNSEHDKADAILLAVYGIGLNVKVGGR